MNFGDGRLDARDVADAIAGGNQIERGVREWQRRHVAGHECRGASFRMCQLQHANSDIEAGDARTAGREAKRDVTRTAGEIQGAYAGTDAGALDQLLLPSPVPAERQQDGDEIVAIGDRVEQAPHIRCLRVGRCQRGVELAHSTAIVPFITVACGVQVYSARPCSGARNVTAVWPVPATTADSTP